MTTLKKRRQNVAEFASPRNTKQPKTASERMMAYLNVKAQTQREAAKTSDELTRMRLELDERKLKLEEEKFALEKEERRAQAAASQAQTQMLLTLLTKANIK
ncbi:TPA: hypothetical protein N0F65_003618 [Lagenidium giganteum]|uniref:Uncharacterized protein n=1 Tax=Lagenidium giganteum TaxID=4803 RepID=A0AAV2Z5N8_9STRA|nr:TPA: hypothetical protein N0F65_003618 [Lagenidium giganteum]